MKIYYNEIDPFCAQWLASLMQQNLIPQGDIDTRDIRDVRPADLESYTQCHFFAGIGGWPLALRLATVGADVPLWTGSCPCQPFSQAGRRRGFDDERHLWPHWHWLIAQRRPAIVFGEQVASASEWLGLVRGDLEALDYAVGAMPVEAASAGADHLRDRFWFVGHDTRNGWGKRRPEYEIRSWRPAPPCASGVGLADANDARLQGRPLSAEGADQWPLGPDGVANTDQSERRISDEQSTGQQPPPECDPSARDSRDLADSLCDGDGSGSATSDRAEETSIGIDGRLPRAGTSSRLNGETSEWVIGADGKARRVKPGVRLLVDGFPNRVGLLRGFGNAIDPRPAAAFVAASFEALGDLKQGNVRWIVQR